MKVGPSRSEGKATMKNADLDVVRLCMTTLMVDAGHILMGYFRSGAYGVMEKQGVDFTTEADVKVDQFISRHLRDHFPSAAILTEETAVGSDFASFAKADECWIVDPLDGTTNFSRGDSNFSISIARLKNGVPDLGMVYLPVERKLYWAQSDREGAFLNDEPIKVSQTSDLRQMVVACDWSWDLEARNTMVRHLERIAPHIRQPKSMGSACADLCKMAEGKIDVYIHTGLKPWDVAAAGFICQKAGGLVTMVRTYSPWNPFDKTIFVSNNWGTRQRLHGLMFGDDEE